MLSPDSVTLATNIDNAMRKFQFDKASEFGFKNIGEMNKQTQISKNIIDSLGQQLVGKTGLNNLGMGDLILLSGGDPTAVGSFLTKKFFGAKSVQSKIAKILADNPSLKEVTPDFTETPLKRLPSETETKSVIKVPPKVLDEPQAPSGFKQGSIPKIADDLATEAKKFKTADEFVEAQLKRPEYGYGHSPTEGPRAFNLIEEVDGDGFAPKDMYDQWYGSRGTPEDLESIGVLKQIKNKPEAEVTIYRASPTEEFNYGDWITLSKKYAEGHKASNAPVANDLGFDMGKDLNVYSTKVKAKDIKWAGDDVNEFGYFPESTKSQLKEIWEEANL